jgi:hypothetical protein
MDDIRFKSLITGWQTQGKYQYEFDSGGYTGWCRAVGGRMSDGRYPQWNYKTGEQR